MVSWADDAARPGVHDHSDVNKADGDRDIGQIHDPELVAAIDDQLLGTIRKDGLVVIAVGRHDESPTLRRLQTMLAHQSLDLLVVHDPAELPERRLHASPAIGLELVLDGMHRLDESRVVDHHHRCVVEGGACDPHQPTAFGDGEAAGPVITDMGALGGRGPCR